MIYDILSSDGTVSGEVSTRIYPDTVPQNASFPYITYSVINTLPTDDKDGGSRLDVVGVQVDIYSRDYSEAQTIAAGCRAALDRYSGTNNSVKVDKIKFSNESSGNYQQDLGVFWVSQDYDIRVKR
ncbi:MAG: DUF3168 domain-containing protein [Phaeodactylibacter sp.]|nr:DUF3168 domain-containing protein [Phaeodactylibacter sp.]